MKKTMKLLMFALVLFASLAHAQERTLLLGHGAGPGNPRTLAADMFTELVAEASDGRIEVQVQGSEQLGSDVEMLDSVILGTLDMTANSQGPLANLVPEAALLGLPFLFDEPSQAWSILDGEFGNQLAAAAAEQGMVVLAWWDNGIRHITNNARPINTPEDVAGLNIRTPQDPMTIDIFSTLGANPTPIAFGELYLALQQGVVDGQENPLVNIWASDIYEVQEYLSITGHKYEVTPFIISQATWESLSEEDQAILRSAAREAGDFQRQELLRQSDELLEPMQEAGVAVNEADAAAFREATASVYDEWREQLGSEVVDSLVQAVEQLR